MKITYVGNFSLDFTTETHIYKTLLSMGHEVVRIQETPESNPGWVNNVPADTDLFLFTRTWGNMVTLSDLDVLRARGIPSASYHLDLYVGLARSSGIETDPFWRTDFVFSADGDPESQKFFESKGINHYWLMPGVFDQECYILPKNNDPRLQGDVIFVGGGAEYGHPEWPYRHQLVKHLEETFGPRYKKFGHPQLSVRGNELNQLYANAKIAIGDSVNIGFKHKKYTSDRLFESIGRGAFTIYPRIEGVADIFPDELQDLFYTFGDFNELDKKINYYLQHEDERERLRRIAHEFVKSSQTYVQRLQELLDTITHAGAFGDSKSLTEPLTREMEVDNVIEYYSKRNDRLETLRRERRFVVVPVSIDMIGELFVNGTRRYTAVGLPKDALFVGADKDIQQQSFQFIYVHESFEPVPEGTAGNTLLVTLTHHEG